MPWQDWVPGMGTKRTRKRVDEVFSRQMMGSVVITLAFGKMIEKLIAIFFPDPYLKLLGWTATFVIGVYIFAYWERLAGATADDAKEKAKDAADTAKEKTAEAAEKAKEKAADGEEE